MSNSSAILDLQWAAKSLTGEINTLSQAIKGGRNNQLNASSYFLGQLIGSGLLTHSEVEAQILQACRVNGLLYEENGKLEVMQTMNSGINAGVSNPRTRKRALNVFKKCSPTRVYQYYNEQKELLAEKEICFDKDGKKRTSWRRKVPNQEGYAIGLKEGVYCQKIEGNSNWFFLKTDEERKRCYHKSTIVLPEVKVSFPYRLENIIKVAADGSCIYIVEGEKDVHTLETRIGVVATCGPNGCNTWTSEMSKYFQGVSEVYIIPDNDTAGRKYAEKVSASLKGIVPVIKHVYLPNLNESEDVTDWFEKRSGSIQILEELIQVASSIQTSNSRDSSEARNQSNSSSYLTFWVNGQEVKILGYTNQSEVVVWDGKIFKIPVAQFSQSLIKLRFGQDEDWKETRDLIIEEARKQKIDEESSLRNGIHFFSQSEAWLVISGNKAISVKDKEIYEVHEPIFNGKLIEYEAEEWLDIEHLKEAYKSKLLLSVPYQKLYKQIKMWNWKYNDMSEYMAAFIMLSPFQHIMQWRPWIYLTGPFGSGKSLFLDEVLGSMYASLVKRIDKGTSHSTAQLIGNSCYIPIFDEFEKMQLYKQTAILDMALISNRGGFCTSGTISANPFRWKMSHLMWFASINLPSSIERDGAKKSRLILFELERSRENSSIPESLSTQESRSLAAEIVATGIRNWQSIAVTANDIQSNTNLIIQLTKEKLQLDPQTKIYSRIVDNFRYAMSLLNCARVIDSISPIPKWGILDVEEDQIDVMRSILQSRIKNNESYTVLDYLSNALLGDSYCLKELRNNGVTIKNKQDGSTYLGFLTSLVERYLIKDLEHLKGNSLKHMLMRLEGAISNEELFFGSNTDKRKAKGVAIPWRHISPYLNAQEDLEHNCKKIDRLSCSVAEEIGETGEIRELYKSKYNPADNFCNQYSQFDHQFLQFPHDFHEVGQCTIQGDLDTGLLQETSSFMRRSSDEMLNEI